MRLPDHRLSLLLVVCLAATSASAAAPQPEVAHPIWFWPVLLFLFSLVLGIVAVVAGVGGGVLYVPLVDAFFPFSLDFVRGAGLLIAVAGALSSGPELLRRNLASLRVAVPCALMASIGSIVGALAGLAIPQHIVQIMLGVVVIGIALLMARPTPQDSDGAPPDGDPLAQLLAMGGQYLETSTGATVTWQARRVGVGLALVFVIGVLGGMFGVGAGWAKVPTLNLLMGIPLKVATGSSVFLISMGDVAGAWVYLNQGSVLPIMVVPSVVGLMLGAKVGAKLLNRAKPTAVRRLVVVVLLFAGAKSLLAGLGAH